MCVVASRELYIQVNVHCLHTCSLPRAQFVDKQTTHLEIYVSIFLYVYIHICVCVCMYVYTYTYMYILYREREREREREMC